MTYSPSTPSNAFKLIGRREMAIGFAWDDIATGRERLFSGGAHKRTPTDIERLHLVNLLLRDWFRRTWVIQEAASVRRAVILTVSNPCLGKPLRTFT